MKRRYYKYDLIYKFIGNVADYIDNISDGCRNWITGVLGDIWRCDRIRMDNHRNL